MSADMDKDTLLLVIDDEPGLRDLLSFELGMLGYKVVTAGDGEEALQKVKGSKVQLVISDINMPKMNGLEALDGIKKINSDIEVIMVTGYGTPEMAATAKEKGAYAFIDKPYNLDSIQTLIERALQKKKDASLK